MRCAIPFPMRPKPMKPTFIFPFLSTGTWGSPRCSRRCVAARQYTASGCFDLALADYPSLSLPSRPTRKEHCDVEYSPIAFYPRLRRFSSGVAQHGLHRRGIQVDRFCDPHARDDLALYWLRSGTSDRVVADVEIAMFFFTTPVGIITLILGGSLIVAITAVETACLMAVGVGMTQGVTLNASSALRFGAAHALNVFRLMANMVLRVLVGLIPFLL